MALHCEIRIDAARAVSIFHFKQQLALDVSERADDLSLVPRVV